MSEVETTQSRSAAGGSFISLTSGSTRIVRGESTRGESKKQPATSTNETGVVYTRAEDMPSLEELLRRNQVAHAVLEKEMPVLLSPVRPQWLVVAAASVAGGTVVGGFVALVDAIDEEWLHANPYTALLFALGGFVLIATLLTALRSGGR